MSVSPYQLFRVDDHDGVPVVAVLCSELRADTVIARLEQELEKYLKQSGTRQLVLDLTAVHYITSSGLRVLIVLRKWLRELGGRFTMCGVHEHVASVFKTTRLFSDSFDYLPDVESAATALQAEPPVASR